MTRNPASNFVALSIDAVRDVLGEAPPALTLAGTLVRTTSGGVGGGRAYFACPACGGRVLLLFFPRHLGPPACRRCWRIAHPSSWLHRSAHEPAVAAARRAFA
jgi:hypothetical protein